MADPKIRYDIEANVQGGANVEQLASGIEKLAETLDGDLKKSALASADALRQLGQKDGAIQTFVDLKKKAQESAIGLKDAQEAAQKLGAELSSVQTPTRAQTGQLQKLRDAVRDAKTEVVANNAALIAARDGMSKYGVSTDNLGQSQRNVRAALAGARTEVADMAPAWQAAADGANDSADRQVQAAENVESGLDGLKSQLDSLRDIAVAALGGSYLGSILLDIAETADAYNNLQARMMLVTGEGAAFEASFEAVTAVALRTNSSLESTGTLFARIAEAGESAGLGSQAAIAQALSLTETVNQAVQLSGASAQASDAAITQLIQGLQGGVLRGDEFNSVMEQAPRLAKALAEGLQVTTGELREMAEAGQLSSDVVIKALQGQADVVATEFSKLPSTVGRAIQNLTTSWTLYVGESDKAVGSSLAVARASSIAAQAINLLSTNLSTVAGYLLDAGQAAAAFVALRLGQHFLGLATAAASAATSVTASTTAITAANAASVGAAASVGRFAAILGGLKTFTLLGLVTNFQDIGTWIGESAAKLAGFKDRTNELISAERVQAQIIADNAAQRVRMEAATQAAIDKQFELSAAARTSIGEFDKLVKAGSTAAEAVAKIGKDFDLSTSPGIKNASAVLDKLAADGKLSAQQVQTAWSEALKTTDLAVFETQARAALSGTAREAERLAQVLDATLRTAVQRTGLDFDVISGGMGKASRSAINDTDAIIQGLDRLKKQGVDTAQTLVASFAKGINTADSQKAIEAVRLQIEGVRKVLGDQVANGLLDQAAQKALELKDALDKATPGINSVREAMKQLGVTSDQTFKDAATQSKAAYDAMKDSGISSARELADGFKKMAADQIAASGEVGSTQRAVTEAVLKTEGAVRGLSVSFDASGKIIVQTQAEAAAAINKTTGALGGQKDAVDAVTSALEQQNAAQERANAAVEKAAELDRKRRNVDKNGFLIMPEATMGAPVDTKQTIYKKMIENGLTETQSLKLSDGFERSRNPNYKNGQWTQQLADEMNAFLRANAQGRSDKEIAAGTSGVVQSSTNRAAATSTPAQATAKSYTVNVNIAGKSTAINTSSDADAQALIGLLQSAKLSSGL